MAPMGVISFLIASLSLGIQAQSVPTLLPGNWSHVGCYTDISTSRTLAATYFVSEDMTVEACMSFCSAANYIYAGVEFGNCDSTIQIPSQAASLDDCYMPCDGNGTETCGGPVRLNVFNSNEPPPVIVPSITSHDAGLWTYQGCFTDTVNARTLGTGINIPGGTTAESCTAACQAAGGYLNAGLENGHECWCDNSIHAPTQRTSDADCRMVCTATHREYCGNQNRLAIYQYSASGEPPGPQACLQTSLSNFTLQAQFKNPPINGPLSVPVKVVVVEMVKNVLWTVLSACPLCCSEWPALSMQNSIIAPHSVAIPTQEMASTYTNDGESPGFVASIPAFPGFQSYCTMTDSAAPPGSPPILAFDGKPDAFSLCTNTSANARLDVVFSPVTGHPHYLLDDCQPINIQVISGSG